MLVLLFFFQEEGVKEALQQHIYTSPSLWRTQKKLSWVFPFPSHLQLATATAQAQRGRALGASPGYQELQGKGMNWCQMAKDKINMGRAVI